MATRLGRKIPERSNYQVTWFDDNMHTRSYIYRNSAQNTYFKMKSSGMHNVMFRNLGTDRLEFPELD